MVFDLEAPDDGPDLTECCFFRIAQADVSFMFGMATHPSFAFHDLPLRDAAAELGSLEGDKREDGQFFFGETGEINLPLLIPQFVRPRFRRIR